jgi:predicted nuclease with TOPRIM domain
MTKPKLDELVEKYKALQEKLEKLQSTSSTTPEKFDEVKKELETTSMLITELQKEEDLQRAKKAPVSKITQEIFAALKRQLLEVAPRVKNQKKELVPDPKAATAIDALKVSDCEIVSSKGNVIVLHAGSFGMRKVVIE